MSGFFAPFILDQFFFAQFFLDRFCMLVTWTPSRVENIFGFWKKTTNIWWSGSFGANNRERFRDCGSDQNCQFITGLSFTDISDQILIRIANLFYIKLNVRYNSMIQHAVEIRPVIFTSMIGHISTHMYTHVLIYVCISTHRYSMYSYVLIWIWLYSYMYLHLYRINTNSTLVISHCNSHHHQYFGIFNNI